MSLIRVGAVASLLVLLAACGSSSSSKPAVTPSSQAGSVSASTASGTGTSGTPSGKPVEIGVNSTDTVSPTPTQADGFQAWAAYVNDHGGIAGRPVKVDRCDDAIDPAKYSQCARGFIDNSSTVAVVGGADQNNGPIGISLYDQAKMPFICSYPAAIQELSGTSALCINSGGQGGSPALVSYFTDTLHMKRIAAIGIDAANVSDAINAMKPMIQQAGGSLVAEELFPLTATSLTPQLVAAMQAHPQAIIIVASPQQTSSIISTAKTLNYDGAFGIYSDSANDATAAMASGNIKIYAAVETANPGNSATTQAFFSEMQKLYPKDSTVSAASGWAAGLVLQQLFGSLNGNITRSSVLNALKTMEFHNIAFSPSVLGRSLAPKGVPALQALGNPFEYIATPSNGHFVVMQNGVNIDNALTQIVKGSK